MEAIQLRNQLRKFMWAYEAIVIAVCITAGVLLAVNSGGDIIMAIPLLLIAAAECLRIPISAWAIHLRPLGQALAVVVLLAIAVGSFEGLSIAFEQFVNNRVINVMRAENDVADAKVAIEAKDKATQETKDEIEIAKLAVVEANKKVADHHATKPRPPEAAKGTCTTKSGQRIECSGSRTNAATFRMEVNEFNSRSRELDTDAAKAQKRVDDLASKLAEINRQDMTPITNHLRDAQRNLKEVLRLSPMHRLAASIYGVKVTDLSEDQFETVKKYAVFGLAGAFSILSMLVSVIAHQKPHDGTESKVSRALRKYLARIRKPIVTRETVEVIKEVIVEKIVEKPVDKIVTQRIETLVPYDYATGRRINPDATLGEKVSLKAVSGGRG
jgi:hypothetical protein